MNTMEQTDNAEMYGARYYSPNRHGNGKRQGGVAQEMHQLIVDVEELSSRLVDATDPEIARLRGQLERTVAAAKEAVAARSIDLQTRAREMTRAADDYVRNQPWHTIGTVALAAALIGFMAARR